MSLFKKAVKTEAKLRMAIAGPSGSGKTYSALAIGTALADGKPVALVDTEHGSASKYADIFEFDVAEMHAPFHPQKYVAAIQEAAEAGYGVVILDSMTHAWNGPGGLLEIVDEIAKRMKTANTFAAWKDATPIQNAMIEALLGTDIHIIVTMRSKQEYVLETVDRGNGRTVTQPRKVGMAPIQRDGFEYEFDVFLDMDIDNTAIVTKTRCPALAGKVFTKPGVDVSGILSTWLSGDKPDPQTQQPESPQKPQEAPHGDSQANGTTDTTETAQAPVEAPDNPFEDKAKSGDYVEIAPGEWAKRITEHRRKTLHALGTELYAGGWEEVRHRNVGRVTNGRTNSSNDLSEGEAEKLIAGMLKLKSKRAEKVPA